MKINYHKDIDETVEKHFEELGILSDEQITHWLEYLTLNEIKDLFSGRARRIVGYGPSSLFLHAQLSDAQNVYQKWYQVGLNDRLDL